MKKIILPCLIAIAVTGVVITSFWLLSTDNAESAREPKTLQSIKKNIVTSHLTKQTTSNIGTKSQSTSVQRIINQFKQYKSAAELMNALSKSLIDDEATTILAWAALDTPLLEDEFYEFTLIFKEHFSARYSALEAMKVFEAVKGTKYNHYRSVAVELLHDHNQKDSPEALIEFLDDPNQQGIASLVPQAIGFRLAEDDPIAALNMIEQLNNPEIKQLALEAAYIGWGGQDLEALSSHIAALPSDERYDRVVENISAKMLLKDHETGMAWAENIVDEGLRTDTILSTAKAWQNDSTQLEHYQAWKETITDTNMIDQLDTLEASIEETNLVKAIFSEPYAALEQAKEDNNVDDSHVHELVAAVFETEQAFSQDPENPILAQHWSSLAYRLQAKEFAPIIEDNPHLKTLLAQYQVEEE